MSELRRRMVEEGYIREFRHPTLPLTGFNYTERAQYGRVWNAETMRCRGLVIDDNGTIVARPFGKFFNLSEHESPHLPDVPIGEPFEAFEKLDGSLGIAFFYKGEWHMCTRGSFESEQAQVGREMLEKYTHQMDPALTYMFEVIYPENRIVVRYERRELVLLATIRTETGEEIDHTRLTIGVRTPNRYAVDTIDDLPRSVGNFEGYVIRFTSGMRVKVKLDEYIRLHRIATGWSDLRAWECLRNGDDMSSLLTGLPDEIHAEIRESLDRMRDAYTARLDTYYTLFNSLDLTGSRKDQAMQIVPAAKRLGLNSSGLFALLDGQQDWLTDIVWKDVRP